MKLTWLHDLITDWSVKFSNLAEMNFCIWLVIQPSRYLKKASFLLLCCLSSFGFVGYSSDNNVHKGELSEVDNKAINPEYEDVLKRLNAAIFSLEKISTGSQKMAELLGSRANLLLRMGLLKEAHEDAMLAYRISDSLQLIQLLGNTAKTLVEINSNVGNLTLAKSYLTICVSSLLSTNNDTNTAEALQVWGSYLREVGSLDSAVIILDSCIIFSRNHSLKFIEAKALNNLGIVLAMKNNLDLAYVQFNRSFKLLNSQELKDESICETLNNLIYLHYIHHEYDSVFRLASDQIELSIKLNYPITLAKAYMHLSNAFKATDQFDSALVYSEKFYQLKDSLFNLEVAQRISLAEYKSQIKLLNVQNDLNESNLKASKYRNFILLSILIGSLFVIIRLIIIYSNQKKANRLLFSQVQEMLRHRQDVKQIQHSETFALKTDMKELLFNKLIKWEESLGYLAQNCTLDMVSKACETNSKYLSIIISEYYKKRFPEYVNDLRIKHILDQLQKDKMIGRYSIEAMSQMSGYKSTTTFVGAFKNFTGLTPSAYLKELAKNKRV